MSTSVIISAARLAKRAHEGQVRKYTGRPYFDHPARVAAAVACLHDATENMVAAAFLHDVLEDVHDVPRAVVEQEILESTNNRVLSLVSWLTNSSTGLDLPRAHKKQMDFDRLLHAPEEAKRIKMLDRLDNLQEMGNAPDDFRRMYAEESKLLLDAIRDADWMLALVVDQEINVILNAPVVE